MNPPAKRARIVLREVSAVLDVLFDLLSSESADADNLAEVRGILENVRAAITSPNAPLSIEPEYLTNAIDYLRAGNRAACVYEIGAMREEVLVQLLGLVRDENWRRAVL